MRRTRQIGTRCSSATAANSAKSHRCSRAPTAARIIRTVTNGLWRRRLPRVTIVRMKRAAAIALLFVATSLFADAADEVRQTETVFAKAFADRDKARFFAFVADDAQFLGRRRISAGKKEVIE